MGSAFAQAGSTGAISGTVKDEKGAIVTGAQVEVVNSTTGLTERTTTSDSNGNFGVTQLPPGTYKLVVTASGFSKSNCRTLKSTLLKPPQSTSLLKSDKSARR